MASITPLSSFNSSQPLKIEREETSVKKNDQEAPKDVKDEVNISSGKEDPHKMVQVKMYPQDPIVGKQGDTVETETVEIEQSKIGNNLQNSEIICKDSNSPIAIADPDGNFFYSPSDPQFTQVTAFTNLQRTYEMFDKFIGREAGLAFDSPITIDADAGEMKNAYYSRQMQAINLFHFKSTSLNKIVKTGDSTDVSAHEGTHSKLDSVRPLFISGWGSENRAYHEAIADAGSMFNTLLSEKNLTEIIKETGGDLRKNNRLSMLGEEFGTAARREDSNPNNDNETYIRNHINNFSYVPINELPSHGGSNVLTSEVHNFSRILSGAVYDCIEAVFNKSLGKDIKSASQEEMVNALKKSRDTVGQLVIKSIDLTSAGTVNFKQAAQTMLKADIMVNNGENQDVLSEVFTKRDLITPETLSSMNNDENLAKVKLDKTPESRTESMEFLKKNEENLGINADEYTRAAIKTDKYGYTIMEYLSTTSIPILGGDDGPGRISSIHRGLSVDAYGGLTLAFDKEGNLVSKVEQKPDKEEVLKLVKDAIEQDKVRDQSKPDSNNSIYKSNGKPYLGEIYKDENGNSKIRRIPVIIG